MSIYEDGLEDDIKEAMNSSTGKYSWLQKNCNVWGITTSGWMDMQRWKECEGKVGRKGECMAVAVDVSGRTSMASVCWLFRHKGTWKLKWDTFVPEDVVADDRELWLPWEEWYETTPGSAVSPRRVREHIERKLGKAKPARMYFDALQGDGMMEHFSEEWDMDCVRVTRSASNYGTAMIRLEELVVNGEIVVDANPVARWAMGNVEMKNPAKPMPTQRAGDEDNRIEPAYTALMATLSTVNVEPEQDTPFRDWEFEF